MKPFKVSTHSPPKPNSAMGRVRDMRLMEDQRKIETLARRCGYLDLKGTKGTPPFEYSLEFNLQGYVNANGDTALEHPMRLIFPEKYPFSEPPKFTFLNGLFHPNIYRNGDVCLGWYLNNWNPAIHIDDLLIDIAKIICFKKDSYNLKSPANYACSREWIAEHTIPIDDADVEPCLDLPHPITKESYQATGHLANKQVKKNPLKVTIKTPYKDLSKVTGNFEPPVKPIKIVIKKG